MRTNKVKLEVMILMVGAIALLGIAGFASERIIRMRSVDGNWNFIRTEQKPIGNNAQTAGKVSVGHFVTAEDHGGTVYDTVKSLANDDRYSFSVYTTSETYRIDQIDEMNKAADARLQATEKRLKDELVDAVNKIPARLLTEESKKQFKETVLNELTDEIKATKKDFQDQIDEMKGSQKDELDALKKDLQKQIDEIKKKQQ